MDDLNWVLCVCVFVCMFRGVCVSCVCACVCVLRCVWGQGYNAGGAVAAAAAAPAATSSGGITWDASNLGPQIALSNGNLSITRTTSDGWGVQRGSVW